MRLKIWICILFAACSSGSIPGDVLPPEKMKKVAFDVIRVDEFSLNFLANDSSKDLVKERSILYEKVFTLHNTSKEEFFNSYDYYLQHPDVNKQLFDSLLTYGKRINETKAETKPGAKPVKDFKPTDK
ncbi:DUF4296 domain-containing protein [Aridibaculum aurantiacum]|uniref:DUF4296 domain-containing protein n=1 Tax=Aridibaculum aurantiacum TaxID=2810307 RepID=UPI001A961EC1|nr:DUF4296 domain-containing protein [Aridibaculum aurantiacum]